MCLNALFSKYNCLWTNKFLANTLPTNRKRVNNGCYSFAHKNKRFSTKHATTSECSPNVSIFFFHRMISTCLKNKQTDISQRERKTPWIDSLEAHHLVVKRYRNGTMTKTTCVSKKKKHTSKKKIQFTHTILQLRLRVCVCELRCPFV